MIHLQNHGQDIQLQIGMENKGKGILSLYVTINKASNHFIRTCVIIGIYSKLFQNIFKQETQINVEFFILNPSNNFEIFEI